MSVLDGPKTIASAADEEVLAAGGTDVGAPKKRPTKLLMHQPWPLVAGSAVLGVVVLVLLLTPWIAPSDPAQQDLTQRLAGGSAAHWLGTDQLGRDLLARLMYGGRFSVTIAGITVAICAVVGTLLTTLILALSVGGWTPFAKLARGVAMEVDARGFIEAARALGCSRRFIVLRHLLPNSLNPLMAHAALRFGHKLITVGALSYLGLGVQPPAADWGSMLAAAQPFLSQAPHLVVYPGLAIFVTALSVTMIGQGINARRGSRS